MTKDKGIIPRWKKATDALAGYFVKKYFGNDASDVYWVGDIVGSILTINDYFFDLLDIVDYIRYRYSTDKMFEYYDYALKCRQKNESPINIKNYKKLKNEK